MEGKTYELLALDRFVIVHGEGRGDGANPEVDINLIAFMSRRSGWRDGHAADRDNFVVCFLKSSATPVTYLE